MKRIAEQRAWIQSALVALIGMAAVGGTTALLFGNPSANSGTVGFVFLVFVTLAAYFGNLAGSIVVSAVAALDFDYFFLPPAGTFNITSPSDWISLGAFLLVAVIISNLTAAAARSKAGHDRLATEVANLAALGRGLVATPSDLTLTDVAQEVVKAFGFPYCSLHVYRQGRWDHSMGSATTSVGARVEEKLLKKDSPLDWTVMVTEGDLGVRYVPVKNGTETFAVLAVQDDAVTAVTLRALGSLVGVRLSTG